MSQQFAVSEPVFVPRTEYSQEVAGYLLAAVYDAKLDKNFLSVQSYAQSSRAVWFS